jgi:hypothetical protein
MGARWKGMRVRLTSERACTGMLAEKNLSRMLALLVLVGNSV